MLDGFVSVALVITDWLWQPVRVMLARSSREGQGVPVDKQERAEWPWGVFPSAECTGVVNHASQRRGGATFGGTFSVLPERSQGSGRAGFAGFGLPASRRSC